MLDKQDEINIDLTEKAPSTKRMKKVKKRRVKRKEDVAFAKANEVEEEEEKLEDGGDLPIM